jgi:hypothetical protein
VYDTSNGAIPNQMGNSIHNCMVLSISNS